VDDEDRQREAEKEFEAFISSDWDELLFGSLTWSRKLVAMRGPGPNGTGLSATAFFVLLVVARRGPIGQEGIQDLSGLAKASVSDALKELRGHGMVREEKNGPSPTRWVLARAGWSYLDGFDKALPKSLRRLPRPGARH
jgi:hypothetical protein